MFRPLMSAIFRSCRYNQFDGASQQILRIFFLHKIVVHRVHKIPPLVTVLSHINPNHAFPTYFPEIHINNILRLRGRFFHKVPLPKSLMHLSYKNIKSKGKSVQLQAWTGPEDSRKLRLPDLVTTAQDGSRLSALRTGRLYPQEILLLLISVRG